MCCFHFVVATQFVSVIFLRLLVSVHAFISLDCAVYYHIICMLIYYILIYLLYINIFIIKLYIYYITNYILICL